MFAHGQTELETALQARVALRPDRLLRQKVQQFVQQISTGHLAVEDVHALLVAGAQADALLDQRLAQLNVAAHVGEK